MLKYNKLADYFILMRFDKPVAIIILLLPCLWSLALSDAISNIKLLTIFTLGSMVTRALGGVINDLVDKDIDKLVERTKNRLLASGKVSVKEALCLILILSIISLILVLFLGKETILIALCIPILMVIYPFLKRITYFPQLFLGFTYNLGGLMAGTAVSGRIENYTILLYIASIFWTLGYDTIYAHQDKYCDKKIGVKSTALVFEQYPKLQIYVYYLLMLGFLLLAGIKAGLDQKVYIIITLLFVWPLIKLYYLNLNNAEECGRYFKFNTKLGILILAVILISKN